MARLIIVNGPPGIGKSTLARRWAEEHPGTLCCDVDVLRMLVGGWQVRFADVGAWIRPAALAFLGAYLREGRDVVLPQLLSRPAELARFEAAALDAGAVVRHVVLVEPDSGPGLDPDAAVARFHRRGGGSGADPWHDQVRAVVAASGGDDALRALVQRLADLVAARSDVVVVPCPEGDVEAAYAGLRAVLGYGGLDTLGAGAPPGSTT